MPWDSGRTSTSGRRTTTEKTEPDADLRVRIKNRLKKLLIPSSVSKQSRRFRFSPVTEALRSVIKGQVISHSLTVTERTRFPRVHHVTVCDFSVDKPL